MRDENKITQSSSKEKHPQESPGSSRSPLEGQNIKAWLDDVIKVNICQGREWNSLKAHQFSSFPSLSRVQLFATPWTAAHQASMDITNSLELTQTHFHPAGDAIQQSHPLSSLSLLGFNLSQHLQSSPRSQFFASGGQNIGLSASVPLMTCQDCSPLGWTGWISLQSKGLSRVFSESINSLALSFLYSPNLTSLHDYWKNHSFD